MCSKSSIDLRQKFSDQAIANGQVPGLGMRGGMKFGNGQFNNGQPWTDDQIKAWSDAMQARLKAQEEAMKSSGKFTDEQIKAWNDAMQAQLKVQEEAEWYIDSWWLRYARRERDAWSWRRLLGWPLGWHCNAKYQYE